MVSSLIVAFLTSLALSWCFVFLSARGNGFALDLDVSGPQKFHSRPVPRVGGIPILLGLMAGVVLLTLSQAAGWELAWLLLLCAAPAFAAGLWEDLTRRVSPAKRLLATALSAVLAIYSMGALISRTDIPGLDLLVSVSAGAWLVTILAVAGLANSVNIIDGFNGLASMCVMLMMAAIAYVAYQVGDPLIGALAVAGIGAVLGFFLLNFPAGLIFLGDGGSYFLGFFFAELAILLLVPNPGVSPLFPLVVCIYPVFETVFSIYRRKFLRDLPPSLPDGIHLHSLIYRRVLRWTVGDRSGKALTRRNSMTSPYLWVLCMCSVIPAVLFWDNSAMLASFLALFGLSYVALYWRIVRFRSPRWLKVGTRRVGPIVGKPDNRRI